MNIFRNLRSQFFVLKQHRLFLSQSIYFDTKILDNSKKDYDIPLPWGFIKAQIYGRPLENSKPILALHGFLDNSNSFKPLGNELTKLKPDYFIIALDLPGHGYSSHICPGIPYTPKLLVSSLRRVVKYFGLNNFTILSHSYGCFLSILYSAFYPNDVNQMILLDMVISTDGKKRLENMIKNVGESIDSFIDIEEKNEKYKNEIEDSVEKGTRLLTKEIAIEKLLKANRHLDEQSASLLLERALVVNKDNKLEFSRDIRFKKLPADHFIEFHILFNAITEFKTPILFVYAWPPSYGESAYQITMNFLSRLKQNSKETLETLEFEGSHHFHMIQPEKTSSIILKYLKKF